MHALQPYTFPLWLLLAALATGPRAEAPPIRFAPLPLEDGGVIHEQFLGLTDYLSEALGRRIQWVSFEDYARLIAAFAAGEVDLTYLGPLPLVILTREDSGAEPLGCFRDADGAASYTCALVAFGGDGITAARLENRTIGLTQPYSTCGYLAVSEMLAGLGTGLDRDGNRFDYAGSHSKAALGVVEGRYELAGVKTAIAHRYAHLDLRILAESRPYPGFALVANSHTLDAETRTGLRTALLRLDPSADPRLAERMRGWGKALSQGTIPAADCDYARVSEALTRLPWPIPGAGIADDAIGPADPTAGRAPGRTPKARP